MSTKRKAYEALSEAAKNTTFSAKTGEDALKGHIIVNDPEEILGDGQIASYHFVDGRLVPFNKFEEAEAFNVRR